MVPGSALALVHRDLIIGLAARLKLPAIYFGRYFVTGGGLLSYGADSIDPHRRAAGYIDRILKGEKPAKLPVQNPTKYELVINLKTAKALRGSKRSWGGHPQRTGFDPSAGDADRIRRYAELVALAPDVILTVGTGSRGPLLQATRAVTVLGHPFRDPNWLLGGGFCRSRCWLGFHNRIGNRLRNIDGFRAGLMGTNHAPPP